jgi:MAD (mothers against decapentaplegic) family protein 2/3
MPQLENYSMTVPEKTDFPTGNNEIFNLPETPPPGYISDCKLFFY